MIENIIIITLSILLTASLGVSLYFRHRHRNILRAVVQLVIDKETLIDKIEMMNLENSKQVNDGFIKFLSESRESAFNYIENVQQAIQSYLVAVENGNADEITTARMELFSHLPEDSENQNR